MPKTRVRPTQRIAQPHDKLSPSPERLSNKQLLAYLRKHFFGPLKRRIKDILPYLRSAHKRFSQPGRRVPVKGRPTWTQFCERELGVSIRTVQRWLAIKPPKKHLRDKYDTADIRHLELVAGAAQKSADDNLDNEAFDPIRKAIKEKPSGIFIRDGSVDVLHNKYYEGNKKDGKHYWLTPASYWAEVQKRYPGIVDVLPYPRPAEYDALTAPWHKMNWANIPFGVTIDPVTGKKVGPTAWARKGIEEQAKGNSTVYPFPVDWFFFLLIKAGAILHTRGPVSWVATEDGSSQPSGRNIVEIFLPGKETKKNGE